MPVSTPKPSGFAAVMNAANQTAPSVPAKSAAPKAAAKGTKGAKHGFPKALEHHAKAGVALKAGDASTAMHHIGHMMQAIKPSGAPNSTMSSTPYAAGTDTDDATEPNTGEYAVPVAPKGPSIPKAAPMSKTAAIFAKLRGLSGPQR